MADSFCNFLDFRPLTTYNYKLHLFLPPKHYYPCAFVHSHSSRIKRRPFHLTPLSKPSSLTPSSSSSSSDIVVISTHEHSDGSLLFRFGDPSEVPKNVEIEESNNVEETEKVLDRDHEKESEVDDQTNLIVTSDESVTVSEGDSDSSCKKLSEGSHDFELPFSISSKATEVASTDAVDIEHAENVEESLNEEYVNSSPADASIIDKSSEMENSITTLEWSEKGADGTSITGVEIEQNVNVGEGPKEEQADLSPADAFIVLENSFEMENNIITTKLLENEAAEVTTLDSLIPDPVITEPDNEILQASADSSPSNAPSILENNSDMENNITTEELLETESADVTTLGSLIADPVITVPENGFLQANADSIPSDAPSILETNSEMENNITTEELLEAEAADVTILDSLMPDPVITVSENDFVQDSVDTIVTADVSEVSKHQNGVESEMQIEIIEDDGIEGSKSDLTRSEPAIVSLSEEIGEQDLTIGECSETDTSDSGVQNAIAGTDNGSNMSDNEADSLPIELVTVSPQLEAESVLDEETSINTVEESREDAAAESLTVDLTMGPEGTEADGNVQSDDSVEPSVNEVTELKSTESATTSQEILSTNFVLSSGAALLPHPSKVLTGGEDAYFIAGETWLGVADGVGQWSFQGTKLGVYAQELVKNCERLISNSNGDSVNNPVELLKLGVSETDSAGSSTVLIAQFDGQALHVANIGDSGFIVLRRGDVYKRSSPMYHVFYFPHRTERGDDPSSLAELYSVDLEDEDVIITATDGLLDNLYEQEISSIVKKSLADDKKPEEIAELLAREAQERGGSASARSPFGDDAEVAGFAGYTGGKLDDVAVIVSVVGRKSDARTL